MQQSNLSKNASDHIGEQIQCCYGISTYPSTYQALSMGDTQNYVIQVNLRYFINIKGGYMPSIHVLVSNPLGLHLHHV